MNFFNVLANRKRTAAFPMRLWLFVAIGVAVSACQSPEERCLDTIREAVYQGDFESGLATADKFYEKHAAETEHPSEQAMALRWEISAYTRLCLLMTDNLNRRFLAYYRVWEMGAMFPHPLPISHWYCYARLYYEMGLYGPALLFILWHVEMCEWNAASVDLLLNIYYHTHQWRAMQTYLCALKNNPKTKKWTKTWEQKWHNIESYALKDIWDGTWPLPLSDESLIGPAEGDAFLDGYVKGAFQHTLQNDSSQQAILALNKYLTDYYTLLCLLGKNLSEVPTLLDVYTSQHRPIPDYLQEATLIVYSEFNPITHSFHYNDSILSPLNISPVIKQRMESVFYDYELLKIGAIPFDDMVQRHAATYTYHLLLGEML